MELYRPTLVLEAPVSLSRKRTPVQAMDFGEYGSNLGMDNALDSTNGLVLKVLKKPNVVDGPAGLVCPRDLPLTDLNEQTKIKYVFDMVGMVEFGESLKVQVTHAAKEGRFHDLPSPFGLKESPHMPFDFQLAVIPLADGQKFLVKQIVFSDRVKGEIAKQICHGDCQTISWQGNAVNLKKAVQFMWEKMGGFQVQSFALQPSCSTSEGRENFYHNLTEEDIDVGFDWIEQHGPRTHHSNTQLRWISKQFINEESPIRTWPERLIKEALRNLMSEGVLALPVHDFPLTLVDVDPCVLEILEKFFPSFTDKALGMHGVPNLGKTPLARTIAMAMSRYWVRKLGTNNSPGYREASEFDFFRGESGRQDRPDIFDDGSLPEQPMRKLKGFCDIGNTVLTKERWGAAKFPQGQFGIYVSNDLDLTAEPEAIRGTSNISHKDFMAILEPAWMKGSSLSDIKALLKRTGILVLTNDFLYWRPATEAEVRVERVLLQNKSLLRASGGSKYMQYRKGYRDLPQDYPTHIKWEEAWMKSVMEQHGEGMPPMPREINVSSFRPLFGSAGPDVVLDVRLPGPGLSSTSPRVKREPSTFHRLQSQAVVPSAPIDLDETPPRKKKARQNAIKQEQKELAQPMSNLTMDVINLLSDDENPGPSSAVPANPDLDIEGMETEEDVFNFGNGLDEGDCR